jgi:uncharacterized membrane protein HdeD (DUF308 family)
MCFGLLVIIVGVIFLLQNLNVLPGAAWNILWPVLVIALGFCFLFRKRRHRHMCGEFKEKMQENFGDKEK